MRNYLRNLFVTVLSIMIVFLAVSTVVAQSGGTVTQSEKTDGEKCNADVIGPRDESKIGCSFGRGLAELLQYGLP